MRWLGRLVGLMAGLVAVSTGVSAHAGYRDASPAAETRVVGTPKYVVVTFTEEIKSISLVVKGPRGVVVTNGEPIISPRDRTNVSVQMHDGGDGRYEVSWDLVSAFDLDTSSGGFGFWVGLPSAAPAAAPSVVSVPAPAVTQPPSAVSQAVSIASPSGAPSPDPTVARDGRSLAAEPLSTQAAFRELWGDQAAVEWAAEHNAQLGPGG
jgi:methionine-rich copper-binding protein CopC